jgi:hypothetical protein
VTLPQAQRLVILTSLIALAGVSIATVLGLRLQGTQRTFERRIHEEGCGDVERRTWE